MDGPTHESLPVVRMISPCQQSKSKRQYRLCDLLTYEIILKSKPRRRREVWVRDWIKRRGALGASSALCRELRDQVEHGQLHVYRLNRYQYMWLLDKVRMQIQERDSKCGKRYPLKQNLILLYGSWLQVNHLLASSTCSGYQ
jgi:hypothetical protein